MHERKRLMAERSDAFLALPGGIGTLEELFEVWTWRQLGYHDKPVGLLNIEGYYDALLAFLASMRRTRLRRAALSRALLAGATAHAAAVAASAWRASLPPAPTAPRRLLAQA